MQLGKDWYDATGGKVEEDDEVDELPVEDLSLSEQSKGKGKAQPPFYDVAYNYVVAFDMEAIAKKAGLRNDQEEPEAKMHVEEVDERKREEEMKQQQSTPSKRGWGFGFFGRG